jgi:NAD(P)-dependent dehydrogenase (short-subunit alcohol dehydrogenase family)
MTTVSLVTGANRGIGREVCRQLAAVGHIVLLTARDAAAAAEASDAVGATPLKLDVTDPASIAEAVAIVKDRYGKLDVLVNNAAITYDTWQHAITADLAVVREAAGTNLYGPWLMIQQFLPLHRNSKHPRRVSCGPPLSPTTALPVASSATAAPFPGESLAGAAPAR